MMNPNNRQARLLLKKYLQGECTPEEIELLHQWYDQLPDRTSTGSIDKTLLEQELKAAIWNKTVKTQAPVRRLVYRIAAAAIFIGIVTTSAFYWLQPAYKQFNNPTATAKQIQLPDGSSVWLNAHSSLKWKEHFTHGQRIAQLDGEAFFDITKDPTHPFKVQTGDLTTKVLGTSFNIENYSDEKNIRIALVTGKVEISREGNGSGGTNTIILQPGQIAATQKDTREEPGITTGNAAAFAAWTTGDFVLRDVPLEDALQRLCSHYGYHLLKNFTSNRRKPISTAYHNGSFDEILAELLYVNHLNYTIKDSTVTVY